MDFQTLATDLAPHIINSQPLLRVVGDLMRQHEDGVAVAVREAVKAERARVAALTPPGDARTDLPADLPKHYIEAVETLDAVRPGWEKGINLDLLNMSSLYDCVLGQTFGNYDNGTEAISEYVQAHDYEPYNDAFEGSGDQQEVWPRIVRHRRGE